MEVKNKYDDIYDIKTIEFLDNENCFVIKKFLDGFLYIRYVLTKDDGLDFKTFDIKKEDKKIYNMFDELFNSIREYRPFNIRKTDLDVQQRETYVYREKFDKYNTTSLLNDGKIVYYSDDFNYGLPAKFIIEKTDYGYRLIFEKSKNFYNENFEYSSFNIKINGSQDKYYPLNLNFINFFDILYNKLEKENKTNEEDFKEKYHQISLDEYIVNQKVLKR